jgi:hypothetical protein
MKKLQSQHALHVSYAEANRLRHLLLAEDVEILGKKDVRTLLLILNDVYPAPIRAQSSLVAPIFAGIGIGIIIVLAMAMFL